MAANRSNFDEGAPAKRQKVSDDMDPRNNPYLAHMYANESAENGSNGYQTPPRRFNSSTASGPLAKFQRHKTSAAMAKDVEDGQTNPFTGEPFSDRYVSILRTRRGLPVHAQRYVTHRFMGQHS
jgi:pre-mRNA-splicing factor ATP-dependent RNA helicase DHX15/PRP43